MYEAELAQLGQGEEHLLDNRPNALQRQRTELVLLQEVVQILLEHLKDQTSVALVLKDFVGAHQVVLVRVLLAQPGQDAHLYLALTSVAGMILENLDGHDLVVPLVPAFDYLTKRAASEELEHLVAVGHRVEDLMQDQLVVALVVAAVSIVIVVVIIIIIVVVVGSLVIGVLVGVVVVVAMVTMTMTMAIVARTVATARMMMIIAGLLHQTQVRVATMAAILAIVVHAHRLLVHIIVVVVVGSVDVEAGCRERVQHVGVGSSVATGREGR